MTSRPLTALLISVAVLAGCASPGGLAPRATLRDANEVASSRTLAGTALTRAAWPTTDWWKAYGDPQLDALMTEALAQSPTLAVAAARTRRALAAGDVARAPLAPRVDATASTTRERFSAHGLTPPPYAG